ncbi:MAG: hypothetical protein KDD94_13185, partial [Calditrichaeota bacterium]|nr:hypothetical protein [Calditrichota bacterium]
MVDSIYLDNNNLIGSIPAGLAQLNNLRSLTLKNNPLLEGTIPSELATTTVQNLVLDSNNLSGSIPPEFANSNTLRLLSLRGNRIDNLPDFSAGITALDQLHVERNRLTFASIEMNNNATTELFSYSPQDSVAVIYDQSSQNLSVSVSGVNNIYQWFKNNVQIAGANTASLFLPLSNSNAGIYQCLITNTVATELTLVSRVYQLQIDTVPPAVPENLSATAGDQLVQLSWSANPASETDFAKYLLYGDTVANPNQLIDSLSSRLDTVYTVNGLTNNKSYYFRLQATDLIGNTSEFSADASATPHFIGSRYTDSLALAAIYNATDGANWTGSHWDLSQNLETFNGITLTANRVTGIELESYGLNGMITPLIGNLDRLELLDLYDNPGLTGSIPAEIGNLENLKILYLISCTGLTGPIPDEIGYLENLIELYVNFSSNISGTIPASIGNLTKLKKMSLGYTKISGPIPEGIGNLDSLELLHLVKINLSGTIPDTLGHLTQLTNLNISNTNLSGSIPSSIGNLVNLLTLSIFSNPGLSGTIPNTIGNLNKLTDLILLSNNLTGSIPTSLASLPSLKELYISDNQFDSFPDFSTGTTHLDFLSIENNKFTFEDIEPNIGAATQFSYSPQDSIGEERTYYYLPGTAIDIFWLYVGGENNTYQW